MKRLLIPILFLLPLVGFAANDTVQVFFPLAVSQLTQSAVDHIDSMLYLDKIPNGNKLSIVGYTDYLGDERANEGLSEARARTVQKYLVSQGIAVKNITLCIGKGEVHRRILTGGYPADRRVDIVVINNTEAARSVIPEATGHQHEQYSLNNLTYYKPGETLIMRNIYFPPESHDISGSVNELDKLYKVLAAHPALRIQIEGHVCCISGFPDAYDMDTHENDLSVNRAKAIYNYLVSRGINAERLRYVGFGKQHPIVAIEHNENDAERNRRVEIRVLQN